MFLKRALPIVAGVALSLGAITPDAQAQFTSEEIVRQVIAPIDVTPGIEGALLYDELRNRTEFTVAIEGLPSGAYTVNVGGVFRGFMSSFRSNRGGTVAELTFSTRQRGDTLLLNFEPRGELIEIRSVLDDDRLYASGRLPFAVEQSENEDVEFENTKVRQELQVLDGSFAEGRIDIKSNRRKVDARLRVKGLVPGVYVLRADGMEIGSLVAIGRGRGNIRLSTRPRGPVDELTFDPTNVMYELVRNDPIIDGELTVLQGMVGNAQDPGGDLLPVGEAKDEFISSGFDADAKGNAELNNDTDIAVLRIAVDDLPEGAYSVLIEIPIPGVGPQLFLLSDEGALVVTPDEPPMEEEEEDEGGDGEGDGGEIAGGIDDGGDGEGGDGEGEMMPEEPMLPQGVGPDNDGVQTTGLIVFTTTGLAPDGTRTDERGNPIVQFPVVDDGFEFQGRRIYIIDSEDRVYFEGVIPDSSFEFPEEPEEPDAP